MGYDMAGRQGERWTAGISGQKRLKQLSLCCTGFASLARALRSVVASIFTNDARAAGARVAGAIGAKDADATLKEASIVSNVVYLASRGSN